MSTCRCAISARAAWQLPREARSRYTIPSCWQVPGGATSPRTWVKSFSLAAALLSAMRRCRILVCDRSSC